VERGREKARKTGRKEVRLGKGAKGGERTKKKHPPLPSRARTKEKERQREKKKGGRKSLNTMKLDVSN